MIETAEASQGVKMFANDVIVVLTDKYHMPMRRALNLVTKAQTYGSWESEIFDVRVECLGTIDPTHPASQVFKIEEFTPED